MRCFIDAPVRRLVIKPLLILGLAVLAAGCESQAMQDASDSTIGGWRMLIGAGEDPNALPVDAGAPPPPVAAKCPPVVIRTGTETYRAYERGHEGDPGHVIYQGGIIKTARECEFISPNAIRIKFGVAGKVITGPSWNNGGVQLPLRAAFVRSGGDPVWTQAYDVQPVLVPGDSVQQFTQVDESLYYEVPEGDHINNYVLYVGFDEVDVMGKRG